MSRIIYANYLLCSTVFRKNSKKFRGLRTRKVSNNLSLKVTTWLLPDNNRD